jgi:hypothetical protein
VKIAERLDADSGCAVRRAGAGTRDAERHPRIGATIWTISAGRRQRRQESCSDARNHCEARPGRRKLCGRGIWADLKKPALIDAFIVSALGDTCFTEALRIACSPACTDHKDHPGADYFARLHNGGNRATKQTWISRRHNPRPPESAGSNLHHAQRDGGRPFAQLTTAGTRSAGRGYRRPPWIFADTIEPAVHRTIALRRTLHAVQPEPNASMSGTGKRQANRIPTTGFWSRSGFFMARPPWRVPSRLLRLLCGNCQTRRPRLLVRRYS